MEKDFPSPPKQAVYILNKIIAKNFSNIKKEAPIQVQEASRTPNRYNQNSYTYIK
jgi:hypothetical protein